MSEAGRQERIKRIYCEALEKEAGERSQYLTEACGADSSLRREVESLLGYETAAGSFIETPALNIAARIMAENVSRVGQQIGPYKILSKIGAGGMGEIWLAEDTRLRRKVALKLLPQHLVMDPERVRRLEREARAASALNHPNILTIYDIGRVASEENDQGDLHYIAMEFIEGMTLRERIRESSLSMSSMLDISTQVASALAAAHRAGIIHRDIKPENVMLRPDGFVKVLDFGLARSIPTGVVMGKDLDGSTQSIFTLPGFVVGTIGYLSPEQARGEEPDERTDVFSLGVVLFEMLGGTRPFQGATTADTIVALLEKDPPPLPLNSGGFAGEVQRIISRALAKERSARYRDCGEFLDVLKKLREEISFEEKLRSKEHEKRIPRSQSSSNISISGAVLKRHMGPAVAVLLPLLAILVPLWGGYNVYSRLWAKNQIERIEVLAGEQKNFQAYDLAKKLQEYLPDNPRIMSLLPRISDPITIETDPPGARVFLRRYLPNESSQPKFIGLTPIHNQSVARGEYILLIEKEGYAPFSRTISSRLYQAGTAMLPPDDPTRVRHRLLPRDQAPARMVFIPGGDYKLACWDKPTNQSVTLGDYFIDQYEVTNQEYMEFILAGGYLRPQYWTHPFIKDGKTISWEEAMREFKDRTSLPGPRNWAGQKYPEGMADHPVTEISWYEAAAYAAFRGKTLPTIFQWEKAARNGLFTYLSATIMPWGPIDVTSKIDGRANFKSTGTRPVGSFEFGMSPFGAYDMAGNVAEWCFNETENGFITAGASWDDLAYLFGYVGSLPAFHRSSKLGFRCVRSLEPGKQDPGTMKFATADQVPVLSPVTENAYRSILSHYRYDASPVNGTVVDAVETPEWRREKISYTGARDERVIAYLYLPKNYRGPYQVIQFVPAGDVYGGYLRITESLEMFFLPHVRSGRAVFAVVFRGFKERETAEGYPYLSSQSVKRREQLVANATDLRRGLDYLATRADLDSNRIAFAGYSQGATEGLIYAAIEPRYRSVVFIAGGIWKPVKDALPENDIPNFAARIRAPKLLINGRFDEVHPFRTMIEPLYRLLPQPKKLLLYDGSHTPPIEVAVPAINTWLDETLGPVG